MEPISVQELHQDGAGVGRGQAIEHPKGVKDWGNCGVVSRVNVQFPANVNKVKFIDVLFEMNAYI